MSDETPPVVVRPTAAAPSTARHRVGPAVALGVIGVGCLLLAAGAGRGRQAVFGLAGPGAAVALPDLSLPARGVAAGAGVAVLALAWRAARGLSRRAVPVAVGLAVAGLVVAFLCWAATGRRDAVFPLDGLLRSTVFLAVPLVLGALAGILCERTGVVNVAIEGQMLAGAFAGALVGSLAGNLAAGVLAGVLSGGLMGGLLAVFAIRYLVNQIVLGVVLNVFALGITGFLYDALMQPQADRLNQPGILPPVKIPLLGDLPLVGPLLFDANVIVYLAYALIVVLDVALFRTRWGLRTRAVGEHPRAADTVGVDVRRTRYRNVVLGGTVAGLGGAYLTIGTVGAFSTNITSGKGFIALAAVIFGRWSPKGALVAALLFSFADALQTVLSIFPPPVRIPSSFLAMLPYLATIVAVAGLVGRVSPPAADGQPYRSSDE